MSEMRLVEFVRNYTGYAAGEVAGFHRQRAARLVSSGVAVPHVPGKNGHAKPAPKPPSSIVEFTQRCGGYNAGEVAGFAPETAARLVSSGVAVPHTKENGSTASPRPASAEPPSPVSAGPSDQTDQRDAPPRITKPARPPVTK